MEEDPALKRILWRCRRGTRELDLILSSFVRSRYPALDKAQRSRFEELLQVQDPVVTDWLCNDATPDPAFVEIVSMILSRKESEYQEG